MPGDDLRAAADDHPVHVPPDHDIPVPVGHRHRCSRWAFSASKLAKDGTGARKLRRTYPTMPSTFPIPGRPNRSSNK